MISVSLMIIIGCSSNPGSGTETENITYPIITEFAINDESGLIKIDDKYHGINYTNQNLVHLFISTPQAARYYTRSFAIK